MTAHEFHRQRVLSQLSEIGISFTPKKRVRWFEIVTGYVVGLSLIVGLSFVWLHFVG